jgi:hypothetical protein
MIYTTDYTHVKTRKLTMTQFAEVGRWIKHHATGDVKIRGTNPQKFIQQYCAEHDGNRKVHELKVHFRNAIDAQHFLMEWG